MSVPDAIARLADGVLEATVVGGFSRIGILARRRLFAWPELPAGALAGKTVLVTGGSSGLGKEAAFGMARLGARVLLLGRDPERTERARDELVARSGNEDLHVVLADMARLAEVSAAADQILAVHDRLDVVVHNAGTLVRGFERTDDAIEVTAQVHVVAPFLLTARLLPVLADTEGSLVLSVTSGGMYTARLDVDALDHPPVDPFDGVRAYAQAKRAQVVLTREWARRLSKTDIRFEAMHPGWADTPGIRRALPTFQRVVGPILRSPSEGVDTTVWLAATDRAEIPNGQLWLDRRPRRTEYLPRTSTPDGEADRLWAWCVERAGTVDPSLAIATGPVA